MEKLLLLCFTLISSLSLYAQQGHEVSGIVKDSTDQTVIGAIVSLMSSKDTLKTVTNEDGIFIFKNVKLGQFVVSVRSLGYTNFNKRFLYSDATKRLVLDPIVLKASTNMINEVKIESPTITYKEDTVEYRAKDYVVKANASVEDLIKKMEGVEVGNDGTVTHQGITVARAKLNGKALGGADLASTIQNLPADIVEKIQMVDDYGDQAARTGIKDGEPERILNIVTRADRSVGNRLQAEAGAGNNERYNSRLNLLRLDRNEQVTARGNFNNTITGVAGSSTGGSGNSFGGGQSGGRGGNNPPGQGQTGQGFGASLGTNSGGVNKSGGTSLSYSNSWKKKFDLNGTYNYSGRNNSSINNSITTRNYETFGTVVEDADGSSRNKNYSHNFNAQFRYQIDSANFLQISPSLGLSNSFSFSDNTIHSTGGIKQDRNTVSNNDNKSPNYGLTALYVHNFRKRGRNVSIQLNTSISDIDQDRTTDNNFVFYIPATGAFYKDSTANLLIGNGRTNNSYRASVTYSEPLSTTSRIEFNGQVNKRVYDNNQITERFINDEYFFSPNESKIFNYSFLEQRYALNYRYLKGKYNISLGFTAVPGLLSGYSETLKSSTSRSSFNIIPIARAEYQWSRQKRFNISYAGSPQEPSFDQIQDVPDISNPQNIVYGNPDLNAQFRHTVSTGFNNYIANSKLNFSVNAQATQTENKVVRNTIEIDAKTGRRETRYDNTNGDYSLNGNYAISKSFADRKYQVSLNGNVNFSNSISMNNGNRNITQVTSLSQRLGIQLYPTKWLDFMPNVRYSTLKSDFTIGNNDSKTRTWAVSAEGRIDFMEGFFMGYNFSKNYVTGVDANVSSNPFIVNSSLSKDFLKKKGTIQLQVFDVFNQNNFVIRTIDINTGAQTDTKSNALSRYVMLNVTIRLQKWTGTPNRNGRQMMRRGDGSFLD